ncbi:MAG: patatin-like protein [Spirulinaceae cyanobacterium SM2_1_0]|nr:patatin-like protein [Spirulinaceae cyanobacterium SM2_1_0]
MSAESLPQPEFQRETRLGLVVYGGVALAVYMNGVCREFYDATRGRGIYKLFKALTDSDIVVDIISGTSAGGINGVLLSYALSNSGDTEVVDFANFADIWRESGDIVRLLRQPSAMQTTIDSLLDGEGYYQDELEAAFRDNAEPTAAPTAEWRSPAGELDLFVTGTDTIGRISTTLDDTGVAIEVKDHRALFHLKHRPGRKEPFHPAPATYQALGKLCRITSCFPAAFPVVTVQIDDQADAADRLLTRWGSLDQRWLPAEPPAGGYRLHFVDGGVLDNRPFSYAIEAIYYRTANRPVERKLFYIDPSPDRFSGSATFRELPRPNIWQAVQESLVGMPSYESISNDLAAIARHNATVHRYRILLSDLETRPPTVSAAELTAQEELYQLSRLVSLRDRSLPLIFGLDDSRIAMQEGSQRHAALNALAQLLYAPSQDSAANPQAAIAPADDLRQLSFQVLDLDVEYLLRKHFYVIRKLRQRAESPEITAATAKTLQLLAERLNRQLRLLEILRAGLNALLVHPEVVAYYCDLARAAQTVVHGSVAAMALRDRLHRQLIRLHQYWLCPDRVIEAEPPPAWHWWQRFEELPERAHQLAAPDYEQLTAAVTNWLPQAELSAIAQDGRQRLATLADGATTQFLRQGDANFPPPAQLPLNLLVQVDRSLQAILDTPALPTELRQWAIATAKDFRALDRTLYPFEYLAGVSEKQLIATVRISPEDAQRGFGRGKGVEEKLAGDSLRAFGGSF